MLGIDVSKDTLACTLFDAQTQKPLWNRTFDNTPQGITRLLNQTPLTVPWVMEPTGRYSTKVARQAKQAGRQVLLAAPKKTRHFLQSLQTRAKTDRLDSYGIGLFALCHSHKLPPYPLKAPMIDQLDQLLCARKSLSLSIATFTVQAQDLPLAAPTLQSVVATLQEQRVELDRQIAQLTQTVPELAVVRELQKVPGIGPVTAATVASRLSSHRFTHSDQFVAYCGLDVAVRQSGKRNGQSGLSKQGDAELRRLLYLAARANLCSPHSPFKAHYERERAKGLSSTQALCAVARKLARLCWSLVTHGSTYEPQRIYQQNHTSTP